MKTLTKLLVITCFACLFTSCEKNITMDDLHKKLEMAFKSSSKQDAEQFFIDWNTSILPNTDEFIKQNDTIETIYEIYRAFYNPLDLMVLGDWEFSNNLNSNSKYVTVQNKIHFAVVENDVIKTSYISNYTSNLINDFRPVLNLPQENVLYLIPEYEKALNSFLGTEAKSDSQKRYQFLRYYIPILCGHWGWYWHIATHPEISMIFLNTDKTTAKISFRVGYQGGEAILKKEDNKWIIEESFATWIE